MEKMFFICELLSSLNLSNFDTSKVTDMIGMFYGCSSLKYINLQNFIENNSLFIMDIFYGIPDNVVICLNENSRRIKSETKSSYIKDCSECWNIIEKNIVNKGGICYDDNNNDILYKYEYEGKYYENCLNGYLIKESPIINCKCDDTECYSCDNIANYYKIENDDNKCYKNPKGYYLNNNIYKKCYYTCEECELGGDDITHKCLICKDNYISISNNGKYFNCYMDTIIESTMKATNNIIMNSSNTKDIKINSILTTIIKDKFIS